VLTFGTDQSGSASGDLSTPIPRSLDQAAWRFEPL